MKVLVVDDSMLVRKTVSTVLLEMGHEVIDAVGGKQAIDEVDANADLNIVLLDWNMPEVDGMDVLDHIIKIGKKDDIKTIMITTETESLRIIEAMDRGASGYMVKPLSKNTLKEKIQSIELEFKQ